MCLCLDSVSRICPLVRVGCGCLPLLFCAVQCVLSICLFCSVFGFFWIFWGGGFSRQGFSVYSPGCPGTHSVDQACLELRNPPASASRVLGLTAMHSHFPVFHKPYCTYNSITVAEFRFHSESDRSVASEEAQQMKTLPSSLGAYPRVHTVKKTKLPKVVPTSTRTRWCASMSTGVCAHNK